MYNPSFRIAPNQIWWMPGLIAMIVLLAITQDLIQASMQGSGFYLSESALFKVGWILFLPLLKVFRWIELQLSRYNSITYLIFILFILVICSVFHITITAIVVHLISWMFFTHTYAITQVIRYFWSAEFYLIFLGYFVTLCFVYLKKTSHPYANIEKADSITSLLVPVGKDLITIPVGEILFLMADRPYVSIHTLDSRYLYKATLSGLLKRLDEKGFVRIHRSTIVSMHFVRKIVSRQNGDYNVILQDDTQLRLSRSYAQGFKSSWQNFYST
ncbi:MAG: LytTR family transcriptional regulator [Saprospiraceae bacterium]|nr:LytTR family transcriptional regulator [Saprospiraceae bacterium]